MSKFTQINSWDPFSRTHRELSLGHGESRSMILDMFLRWRGHGMLCEHDWGGHGLTLKDHQGGTPL